MKGEIQWDRDKGDMWIWTIRDLVELEIDGVDYEILWYIKPNDNKKE